MMKKLFWLVLSTVILTGQSIFAQEADSEVQSSQREDSLLQVVNELSDRVQKTEDAARFTLHCVRLSYDLSSDFSSVMPVRSFK